MVNHMRHTRSHTRNRRSHHALGKVQLSTEASSGMPHLRHRLNMTTGTYRGRTVIDVAAQLAKKQEKQKAKAKALGQEAKSAADKKS